MAPPVGSTTTYPGGSTGAVGSTTAHPGGSTAAHPVGSTTAHPGGSTTAPPGGSATTHPESSTTAPPGGSATAHPVGSPTAPGRRRIREAPLLEPPGAPLPTRECGCRKSPSMPPRECGTATHSMPPRKCGTGGGTPAVLTIRRGDTVTAIHDGQLAQQWLTTLMVPQAPAAADDVVHRLAVIEAALRVQVATGVSHLQQLETAPAAHGLTAEARPAVRRLRRHRNRALHNLHQPFAAGSPEDLGPCAQDTSSAHAPSDSSPHARRTPRYRTPLSRR